MRYHQPLGRYATIVDEQSIYFGETGRVIQWDGDQYHVELAANDGQNMIYPGFSSDQFKVVG